jgi:hypothetical protein
MAEYCIAPIRVGICGRKLPCKIHPDQTNYDEPEDTICLHQRAGAGAPGVCGINSCSKHTNPESKPISKAMKSTNSVKRKRVVKVSSSNKKRKVLDKDDNSYSKSVQESSSGSSSGSSSESISSSESSRAVSKKHKSHSKKSKKHKSHSKKSTPKQDPVPLELAPPAVNILDTYALIEKERQKLLKLELNNSKRITKLIAAKNNISDSSLSSASDD